MTNRIFRSIIIASVSTLLVTIIIIVGVLYGQFEKITATQLESQLDLAAQGVINNGIEYLKDIHNTDFRFTLVANDGKVIFDNVANEIEMENHLGRVEIDEAIKTGIGKGERFSDTRMEKTIYYAKKLPDGNILRISTTRASVIKLVIGMINPIIIILILSIILSLFFAKKMSTQIVKPLNTLDLDNPLQNEIYDEISPLLSHMEAQNRKIQVQIEELKKNQNEFNAIIDNMNEGLIVLNTESNILALNRSAETLFNAGSECIGKNFLNIERNIEIDKTIKTAIIDGHSEINITRNGKVYQLNANAIGNKDDIAGVILLTFDVTDKVFAERNRKEFTANVSHELKTPIQSIMGSAELIESGLVKDSDMPSFISKIRTESSRLVTLIDDIISLSRLDERTDIVFEKVDLLGIARQVISELEYKAKDKNVSITLNGNNTFVNAEKHLVHEIIYNLCENAVKYNKNNGKVKITIESTGNSPRLTVKDTGIGISPEHQERVFERFYRVDKSHSREIGGTGLGLSIVKHATDCIGAKVSLKSELGKGTEIDVEF